MAEIPAGTVALGEDGAQRPGQSVKVSSFRIDRTEVTNREFARFVEKTHYRTRAELDGKGAVFVPPTQWVGLDNPAQWWALVDGADWRHPRGPNSIAHPDEPVVQVTLEDAEAYARWAGKKLPSIAQWERAARGKQDGPVDSMRWAHDSNGKPTANTWQGIFPVRNVGEDGFIGIAPAGCFQPNAFGLYDMVGNVWEWTIDKRSAGKSGIVKGGSFLCSANYCANFRPAGWQAQERDLPTSHIGFRTIDG